MWSVLIVATFCCRKLSLPEHGHCPVTRLCRYVQLFDDVNSDMQVCRAIAAVQARPCMPLSTAEALSIRSPIKNRRYSYRRRYIPYP